MAGFHICEVVPPANRVGATHEQLGVVAGKAVVFVKIGDTLVETRFPAGDWLAADAKNACAAVFGIFKDVAEGEGGGVGGDSADGPPPPANGHGIGVSLGGAGHLSAPLEGEFRFTTPRCIMRRQIATEVVVGVGDPNLVRGGVGLVERKAGSPRISGLAAVYYDGTPRTEFELGPGVVERIMPGAFDTVLGNADGDIVALFNHDRNLLLGRQSSGTLSLESTDAGLAYSIEPGNTSVGIDVVEHIKRRDVTGSSFSFRPKDEVWTVESARQINVVSVIEVEHLGDVGPVTLPAYVATKADVDRAKSLADLAYRLRAYRARAAYTGGDQVR